MYGILNKITEDYIVDRFGAERWETIKQKHNIAVDTSITDFPYNDAFTYRIAYAVSEETGVPVDEILSSIGQQIINTSAHTFKGFMDSRGSNFREYLLNLPNFHNRMMLIHPELTPPEFRVSHVDDNSLNIHYISKTKGIRSFVKGYLNGIADFFNDSSAVIENIPCQNENCPQEVFKISW
jgi:hypothetical protein